MVEGALNLADVQKQTITELQQELTYIRRESDELQVTTKRIIKSLDNFEEKNLTQVDTPRACTLPKVVFYQ